jgi:AcrR family transcriptional regulator
VAKGTVFLDFGSKEGLFLAAYQRAVSMLPAWLDAPEKVTAEGFWATLDWWLEHTEDFVEQDPVPNRIAVIGRYDAGMGVRRPIDRFMRSEDPYGTLEFVEPGVRSGRSATTSTLRCSRRRRLGRRDPDALVSADLDPADPPAAGTARDAHQGVRHPAPRHPVRARRRVRRWSSAPGCPP